MVRTVDGHILGTYGPYQGASNDITLLHASGLMALLNDWERVIADGLFRGAIIFSSSILLSINSRQV